MGKVKRKADPLYQIFEHTLFHKSYDDSDVFAKEVAKEYLIYLDSTHAHVPFQTRDTVLEDLSQEVYEMLVKRMYGCQNPTVYGKVMKSKKGKRFIPLELIAQAEMEAEQQEE